MNNQKPFCLMPWIHLHVAYEGRVQACCISNIPFGNIKDQSLEEIWNGEKIKNTRSKFLAGSIDNRCQACLHIEASGGISIRQETFKKFPHLRINSIEAQFPIYYDIRFSNLCNFRCRTCWHGYSSRWFEEAKVLGNNASENAVINNIHDFDAFIKKTGEGLKQAKEIYFAGGEPLITEEHYLLLQWLIKTGNTNVHLRYNTNCSHLKFKTFDAIELWRNFKKVTIQASIDAARALGEYIRKELNWSQFIKNQELIHREENIDFHITPTVSILNIHELPSFYLYAIEQQLIKPEDLYINLLERPYHYNIKAIPEEQKKEIEHHYNSFFKAHNLPENIQKQFQHCLDFMFEQRLPEKHWNKYLEYNKQLDLLRKEKRPNR